MTQDQYSQARGPGYVVRGDAVPDDETEGFPTEESKSMTRFQKVASALRGGAAERDEPEGDANSPVSPEARRPGGYWDEPGASATDRDQAVATTSPDVPVPPGIAVAPGEQAVPESPESYPEGQTGRHAAAASAGTGSRPGEAGGILGDFSDLTYGNLIPDAAHYTDQWQQVQFKFVDDPRASVTEAAEIVAQVTTRLETAIQERQRAIEERQRAIAEQQRSLRGRWGEDANADTEALRETLRMYRTFLDQLIGTQAG